MSAVVEFGFNAAPVFSGVDKMEQRLQTLDKRVGGSGAAMMGSLQKGSGAVTRNMGMLSMQLQDIAVQLQQGTRASLVLAQQGSQILGAFGTSGAIAGGLIAVGGLFYTMQEKGLEALQALKTEAAGFDQSLRALKTGGIMEMIAGMEKMQATAKAMNEDAASRSPEGFMGGVRRFFSPSRFENGRVINSYDERRTVAQDLALKNEQGRAEILRQIADTSAEELRIAEMRAAGRDAEADKLEREAALRRELAKLESAPEEVRGKLQNAARAKAAAEQRKADEENAKKQQEELQKIATAQQQLDDQKKQAAMDQMTLAQRIALMSVEAQKALAEENRLKGAAKVDAMAVITAEGRRVTVQTQLLDLQKQLASEKKREADEAKRASEESSRANQQRKQAVLTAMEEYELLRAKNTRRKNDDYEVERRAAIRQRREQLMQENGLSFKQADAMATHMRDLEERRNNGGTVERIRGVRRKRMMGGLSGFYADQRDPSAFDALQSTESDFDRLQRAPSAFEMLQRQATQDRLGPQHGANAADPPRPATIDDALQKILNLLPKGIAAAILES